MCHPAVFVQPPAAAVRIRPAGADDLAAVNGVVERAVMGGCMAERGKRLSLPRCRDQMHDLGRLHLVVAEDVAPVAKAADHGLERVQHLLELVA